MSRRRRRRAFWSGGFLFGMLLAATSAAAWKFGWIPLEVDHGDVEPPAESLSGHVEQPPPPSDPFAFPADDGHEVDPFLLAGHSEPSAAQFDVPPGMPEWAAADPAEPNDFAVQPAAANVGADQNIVTVSGESVTGDPVSRETVADRRSNDGGESLARIGAEIDALLERGDYVEAHRQLSMLYWNRPELREQIRMHIERTAQSIFWDPQPHYLEPYMIQPGDRLGAIAQRYNVPWEYLAKLNRVDPSRIRAGQQLKVNHGPFAAVVSLTNFELTVHAEGYFVRRYRVGIGKDNSTPLGEFKVLDKVVNPQYTDPQGRVYSADDPTNPIGERWLALGGGYGIHGTIEPESIGRAESRGCVRLVHDDIVEVYNLLSVGSVVVIQR